MKRRDFFRNSIGAAFALEALPKPLSAGILNFNDPSVSQSALELKYHKIDGIEFTDISLRYPRRVGKNSRKDIHGFGPSLTVATLKTDKGASGWGLLRSEVKASKVAFEILKGRYITDFFVPEKGVINDSVKAFDIVLHDLAGRILQKPVYQIIGRETPISTKCYSGMIYFDDLEESSKSAGLDKILEECQYDYNYGYRQLKVKIGRGSKWMPFAEGLKRDIEVTKLVAKNFQECEILVDGNDGFTAGGIIEYLKGIGDIPLFWVEEPFLETIEDYRLLRNWTKANGHVKYLADGEANPDMNLIGQLEDLKLIDVFLGDSLGYGFTPWRNLMPTLIKKQILTSPHAWGNQLKTYYISHLAGGFGNVVTIEGVTCFSDDVDFGDYKLEGGKLIPSNAPGFGMKLLKKNS